MADGSNLAVVGYLRPRICEGGPCGCADMDRYRYALEHGPGETQEGVDLRTSLMSTSLWEVLTLIFRNF